MKDLIRNEADLVISANNLINLMDREKLLHSELGRVERAVELLQQKVIALAGPVYGSNGQKIAGDDSLVIGNKVLIFLDAGAYGRPVKVINTKTIPISQANRLCHD